MAVLTAAPKAPLTGHRLFRWLGLCSYSVYLWHWPIVVWLNAHGEAAHPAAKLGGLIASLAIGSLSYMYVEQPAARYLQRRRDARSAADRREPLLLVGAAGALCLASLAVWAMRGVPQRFDAKVNVADREALNLDPSLGGCFAQGGAVLPPCTFGKGPHMDIEVMGDSHAAVIAANPSATVRIRAYASCPTIADAVPNDPTSRCASFNRQFIASLAGQARTDTPLVIDNYWVGHLKDPAVHFDDAGVAGTSGADFATRFEAHLTKTVCALTDRQPVYLVLPAPVFAAPVPATMARALVEDDRAPDVVQGRAEAERTIAAAAGVVGRVARHCGARLIDPMPHYCTATTCFGSLHQRPLYTDRHHLSQFGNRLLVPAFRNLPAAARAVAVPPGSAAARSNRT